MDEGMIQYTDKMLSKEGIFTMKILNEIKPDHQKKMDYGFKKTIHKLLCFELNPKEGELTSLISMWLKKRKFHPLAVGFYKSKYTYGK